MARPIPEQTWLIDQLLPIEGSFFLYGNPKGGKTLFALGMALAISDGHDKFLNFDVTQHGKVLYLQADMPVPRVHAYMQKIIAAHPFSNLYIIDQWEIREQLGKLNLLKPKHLDWLKKQIDIVKPVYIVFDTVRTLHTTDENDSNTQSRLYSNVLEAVQKVPFTALHHAKKPTTDNYLSSVITSGRGSLVFQSQADCVGQLTGPSFKKRFLKYENRDFNEHEDGLELMQSKETGLYQLRPTASRMFEQLQKDHPEATIKQYTDWLIEAGVSKGHAYKLVK